MRKTTDGSQQTLETQPDPKSHFGPRNIAVIGDLLIDHTAFVFSAEEHPPPVPGEGSFRVTRRLDSAGGAATTARAANVAPETNVFLWGLVGTSPWGTFREILEHSQDIDGADRRIHLRGIQDETNSSMTTINRLVAVQQGDNGREHYKRHARFSDFGHIHVPVDRQVTELRYTLTHIREKTPLDCIVLNDVEFGALHLQVVECVSDFCETTDTQLILRVRRDSAKYSKTKCRALVCTLAEWCKLVRTTEKSEFWSQNLGKSEVAADFIGNSLFAFRGAEAFIVLVGEDWIDSVILIEQDTMSGVYRLLQLPGMAPLEKGKSQQVGVSDVLVGSLATVLPRNAESVSHSLLQALGHAMNVVTVYQSSRWNHIHRLRMDTKAYLPDARFLAKAAGAAKYLPTEPSISLSAASTDMPQVYSMSVSAKRTLAKMVADTREDNKSMVLVATGGSGKSLIAGKLTEVARQAGWSPFLLENTTVAWDLNDPDALIDSICNACRSGESDRIFLVVDEFLKLKGGDTVASNGVVLLNRAAEKNIRFLFIDADFLKLNLDDLRSQFARRVEWHNLPSAFERPEDVPYVIAAFLLANFGSNGRIAVEAAFLIGIMEWIIEGKKTFGHLLDTLRKIIRPKAPSSELLLRWDDLPVGIRGKTRPTLAASPSLFQITN